MNTDALMDDDMTESYYEKELANALVRSVMHGGVQHESRANVTYCSKHENARSFLAARDDGDVVPVTSDFWHAFLEPSVYGGLIKHVHVIGLYPGYEFFQRSDVDPDEFARAQAYMLAWLVVEPTTGKKMLEVKSLLQGIDLQRYDVTILPSKQACITVPVKLRNGNIENMQMSLYTMRGRTKTIRFMHELKVLQESANMLEQEIARRIEKITALTASNEECNTNLRSLDEECQNELGALEHDLETCLKDKDELAHLEVLMNEFNATHPMDTT